ncbi:MAG: VanW family protein [Coriobacteriia bacterium]|nr:VanW family protein [Coriobacteriia bacterium]
MPQWIASWPRGARIGFVVAVLLVVVVAGVAAVDITMTQDRIHVGVRAGEVDVGGLARDDAAAAIGTYVADLSATPVSLMVDGERWDVTAESVGLSVDATGLAEAAYGVGRGGFFEAVVGRARSVFGGVTIPLELDSDETAVELLVESMNTAIAQPPKDAVILVDGASITRVASADGHGVSIDDMREAIPEAFLSADRTAAVELVTLMPLIDEARAEAAYEAARAMVAAPLELYYDDKTWTIEPATIGSWIDFRSIEGTSGPEFQAYIASDEVSATILPLVAEVGRPAKNATFTSSNGTVSVVPAEDGLSADAADLAIRLEVILVGTGERRAELTMHRVEADLTTEEAKAFGITERISTFTTEFSSSNKARVNNIHVLADALDGTLLAPGETFSFNGTVGERTAAKGYEEAAAIVNGKLVPQLGGGICQVNTTLFNAVFFSGLPVVERLNHSQYISHYPKGRDATVSWGGPDFKFKNDTKDWVLIASGYSNSSVTISLYGTDPGYEVSYDTGPWTNLTSPPVHEIKDPELPVGTRVVDERGASGRTIVVTRVVTKGGVEVRRDAFKSVYRPTQEVVRVGTKPVPVPAPSVPTTATP